MTTSFFECPEMVFEWTNNSDYMDVNNISMDFIESLPEAVAVHMCTFTLHYWAPERLTGDHVELIARTAGSPDDLTEEERKGWLKEWDPDLYQDWVHVETKGPAQAFADGEVEMVLKTHKRWMADHHPETMWERFQEWMMWNRPHWSFEHHRDEMIAARYEWCVTRRLDAFPKEEEVPEEFLALLT